MLCPKWASTTTYVSRETLKAVNMINQKMRARRFFARNDFKER